jgi:hypothetical protein
MTLSICLPFPNADTPPPLGIPSDAKPVATTDAQLKSNSHANAQPHETTSGAERSHSAHGTHSAETARHTERSEA